MENAKHTPGPWETPAGQIVADTVWARDGQLEICALYGNGRDGETVDADARLIAAAPKMLADLRQAEARARVNAATHRELAGAMGDSAAHKALAGEWQFFADAWAATIAKATGAA